MPERIAIDKKIDDEIPNVVIATPRQVTDGINKDISGENIITTISKGIVHFFFDFLETIVVALSIFVVIYLFFVQPHEVKGSSMEPNFHNNEFILTDKISYRFQNPKRGDVIIFRSPNNPDVDYIKRIIALPGEKVKAKNGYIYVDETKLSEKYLNDLTFLFPTSKLQNDIDIIVPQDEYFVLGDNRPHSSDSREFGPISRSSIIGKAFIRYWPLPLLGVIPEIKY